MATAAVVVMLVTLCDVTIFFFFEHPFQSIISEYNIRVKNGNISTSVSALNALSLSSVRNQALRRAVLEVCGANALVGP
jgi:hypothetical protein